MAEVVHDLPVASDAVNITAVWLRRIGVEVQVLIEIDGAWHLAIREHDYGPGEGEISWIAEARGRAHWEPDTLTEPAREA